MENYTEKFSNQNGEKIDYCLLEDIIEEKADMMITEYGDDLWDELEGGEKYFGEFKDFLEERFFDSKKQDFINVIVSFEVESRLFEYETFMPKTEEDLFEEMMNDFEMSDEFEGLVEEMMDEFEDQDEDDLREEILSEKADELRDEVNLEYEHSLRELAEEMITDEVSQDVGDNFESMMSYSQDYHHVIDMDEEYEEYKEMFGNELLKLFMLDNFKHDIFDDIIDEIEEEVRASIDNKFEINNEFAIKDEVEQYICDYIMRGK